MFLLKLVVSPLAFNFCFQELNIMLAAIEYLSLSVGGLLLIISLTGLFASCYQAGSLLSTLHSDEKIYYLI